MIGVLVEIAVAVLGAVVILLAVGVGLAYYYERREKRSETKQGGKRDVE